MSTEPLSHDLDDDPEAQPGALPLFAVLALLSWVGFLHLVKDKLLPLLKRSEAIILLDEGNDAI